VKTTRRLALAMALVPALGFVALAPGARAAEDQLVIRGDRSSVIDVSFERGFAMSEPQMLVSGGGAWSGVVIESLTEKNQLPSVILRVAGLRDEAAYSGRRGQFPPGRYRIRLLTDRPVKLSVPVAFGGREVRPVRPIAVSARHGSGRVTAGLSDASFALTNAIPGGRRAVLVSAVSGVRAEDTRACAVTTRSCSRSALPAALPSPAPPGTDVLVPSGTGEEAFVTAVSSTTRGARSAVLDVQGLRAGDGTMRLFCLAYS